MGWLGAFYGTTIGKKIVVAVTGAGMVLFLVGHLLGNLLIFEGRGETAATTALNEYSELLRFDSTILWLLRVGLLTLILLHFVTIVRLRAQNRSASGTKYESKQHLKATLFSRTMFWGGLVILFYVVYHILHLTSGSVHSGYFTHGDVYSNVIRSFQNPAISLVYVFAQVALFFHLSHGVGSLFRTLGVNHPGHLANIEIVGRVLAFVICLGFISIPVGVVLGIVS